MSNFTDDFGIEWHSYNRYWANHDPHFREYINEINSWSNNEAIKKYIFDGKVGHELETLFKLFNTTLHFATYNDDLIAVMLTGDHQPLSHYEELKEYITSGRHKENIESDINEDFLSLEETNVILNSADDPNLYIEYLVVNPKYHGKGFGTKIFKTLKENIDVFTNNYSDTAFIQTAIHNENIASRKTVIKNGFKRVKPSNNPIPLPYSVYYCNINTKHSTHKDEIENERF